MKVLALLIVIIIVIISVLTRFNKSMDDIINISDSIKLFTFFNEVLDILEVVVLELCALSLIRVN